MKREPSNERHSGTLLPNSGHTEQNRHKSNAKNNNNSNSSSSSSRNKEYVRFLSNVLKDEVDRKQGNGGTAWKSIYNKWNARSKWIHKGILCRNSLTTLQALCEQAYHMHVKNSMESGEQIYFFWAINIMDSCLWLLRRIPYSRIQYNSTNLPPIDTLFPSYLNICNVHNIALLATCIPFFIVCRL